MGWILKLILIIVIVRAIWRLLAGVFQGMYAVEERAKANVSMPLVRDPICGTFVVPSRALALRQGESTRYFCSERCLQQYRSR